MDCSDAFDELAFGNQSDISDNDKGTKADNKSEPKKPNTGLSWRKNGGYMAYMAVMAFFFGEREKHIHLDEFAEASKALIPKLAIEQSEELLKATKELINQQRTAEDTKARRRLERWTKRVISLYLIFVFLLVLFDSICFIVTGEHCITERIMIAILTTTTVNIIGLGIIVLKGHFKADVDKN